MEGIMALVPGSHRIVAGATSSAVDGTVVWDPAKSLWIGTMSLAAIFGAPFFFSWSALSLFLVSSAVTLCCGHSVGMHRRLIHGSFECPLWLEHLFVYLGTLVGMAGPVGMIRIHDLRDWAQRQSECHDFFGHRRPLFHDGWWQLHCRVTLANPPGFELEPKLASDGFYAILERTWMWQQLPWAVLFYLAGGMSWLVWGICLRVAVCVTGHWLVGHFAHREGPQTWVVDGAAVQGHNVALAGFISMGESWHNNHHAFPGSAKLGLRPGEVDPGWWLIKTLERLGLASRIITPAELPARAALRAVHYGASTRSPALHGAPTCSTF
jgi:stearoyl-CoA desaturase (delta-9 desaturase)